MTGRPRSARELILARIEQSLSGSRAGESTRASDLGDLPGAGNAGQLVDAIKAKCAASRAALIEEFEKELAAVGGCFHYASSAQAACDRVVQIAATRKASKAIGWNVALIDEIGLAKSLAEANIQFFSGSEGLSAEDFARRVETADIGVTSVDYALADTGTLVLRSGLGRARSISLLPAVHVALLRPAQIVSGLDDLFPLLAEDYAQSNAGLDSALTFITGPSRTADIELTLVVGVHGPQELDVILLNDENRAKEGS